MDKERQHVMELSSFQCMEKYTKNVDYKTIHKICIYMRKGEGYGKACKQKH